jgi:MATE family multidrug resistance protein
MAETQPVSHRRVLNIALPIVLSNATVPILGAVDTGVVGQMGLAAPIGAVGIGAVILTGTYWIFGFLRMGTTGLTSQAHGAGDRNEVAALLTRALMIGVAAGLAIILLQMLIFRGAFLVSPASPEVEALAREYLSIRIYSAPAAIALYGVTGWLIALERTRAVLVLQLWMNGLNIVLDLWFVLGLEWGVQGVSLATFCAEWSGLALGLWFCRPAFATSVWRDWPRVFDRAKLTHMMTVNVDIMLRSLMLQAIFISFLLAGADFGDITLAANQILLQFIYVTAYALDGFALGAETLVGQAIGARNRAQLRRASIVASVWGVVIAVGLTGTYAICAGWIVELMTTAQPVRDAAQLFLIYIILSPLIGVASFMLDGIFVGATRGRDMRNMMAVSFLVYLAALAVLLPAFGNHGLWAALLISFAARGVTLAWRYPALEASVR